MDREDAEQFIQGEPNAGPDSLDLFQRGRPHGRVGKHSSLSWKALVYLVAARVAEAAEQEKH